MLLLVWRLCVLFGRTDAIAIALGSAFVQALAAQILISLHHFLELCTVIASLVWMRP